MPAAHSRPESRVFWLSAITLSLAMVFGGGQGHLGDTLTQLSALVLLGALLWQQPDLRRWPKASLWLLALFVPLLLFLPKFGDVCLTHTSHPTTAATHQSQAPQLPGWWCRAGPGLAVELSGPA